MVEIKPSVDPSQYIIGVIICRIQVHKLTPAHIDLIEIVTNNHKKVIMFLGVPVISNTRQNPLDFATRREMVLEKYPNIIVLPLKDMRSDELWSKNLDSQISIPFGELSALLYGSRDSFIPYYKGKYTTTELITDTFYSGTEVRSQVSKEILSSSDFRAGIIHANYAQRAVTYPTVDIVAYNDKGQILLAKKPNEDKYRFVGGFADRTDESYEDAASREFREKTGGCEISDLKYIASAKIDDWRYRKTESGIMTTLFLGKFIFGKIQPTDDIESLHWLYPSEITVSDIMNEHQPLFLKLISYIVVNDLK